jgi:hypothetical protein
MGNGTVFESREKRGMDYTPAVFNHQWVNTRNERNLDVVMEMLAKAAGEGVLCQITGPAGRGKTRTIRRYAANHRCIYLLCIEIWKRSELPMLQALCRELGANKPFGRANECFRDAVERLLDDPRPVFMDEADLIPQRINLIRQLGEVTAVPFILVGEQRLADQMSSVDRVWSRTFQTLTFEPVSVSDIVLYGRESGGLEISPPVVHLAHQSTKGQDWRVIKRIVMDLVEIANAKRTRDVSVEMMEQAIGMSAKGNGKRAIGSKQ